MFSLIYLEEGYDSTRGQHMAISSIRSVPAADTKLISKREFNSHVKQWIILRPHTFLNLIIVIIS
jgi:hypothetical protein